MPGCSRCALEDPTPAHSGEDRGDRFGRAHGFSRFIAFNTREAYHLGNVLFDEVSLLKTIRITRLVFPALIGLTILCALPGGFGQSRSLSPLVPDVTVAVAVDRAASDAGLFIAAERGYFKELGIQVEFVWFPSSAEMLPMVASGHIQVAGGITSTSFFNAIDRNIGLRLLADKGHNMPGKPFVNMVLSEPLIDKVKQIPDLRGEE